MTQFGTGGRPRPIPGAWAAGGGDPAGDPAAPGPMEEALRAADDRLGPLLSDLPTFLYVLRFEGSSTVPVWAGANVAHLVGYQPEDVVVPGWWVNNLHPDDRAAALAAQARLLADDRLSHEYRFKHKDGGYRWVRDELWLVRDDAGRPREAVGAWFDITDLKAAQAALQERDERYALATAAGRVAVWDLDVPTGRLIADPSLDVFWGVEPAGEVRSVEAWAAALHPEDLPPVQRAYEDHLAGRAAEFRCEYRVPLPDGSVRWGLTRGSAVRDAAGKPVRLIGTTTDITDRKRAEDELRRSEARYKALVHSANDAVWQVTPDGTGAATGLAWWYAFTGQAPSEEADDGWLDVVHPDDRARVRAAWAAAVTGGGSYAIEYRVRHRSGEYRDLAVRGTPVRVGPAREWIGTFTDVTDRRRAEAALKDSEERLRALSRRLLQVQEQERRHLARELHDEIGQLLTGLKLQLEAAERGAAADVAGPLATARDVARDLTDRVRELSLRLRPSMLDDLGLVPAVRWLTQGIEKQTGVKVAFRTDICDRRFPPAVETAAYRIVQEALTNVARHAGASEASVSLDCPEDELAVTVTDRGRGFDPRSVKPAATGGLAGMRERAELLGGELAVDSAPHAGTTITARLPLGEEPVSPRGEA
jgi:PAS domain S-box-containing protein